MIRAVAVTVIQHFHRNEIFTYIYKHQAHSQFHFSCPTKLIFHQLLAPLQCLSEDKVDFLHVVTRLLHCIHIYFYHLAETWCPQCQDCQDCQDLSGFLEILQNVRKNVRIFGFYTKMSGFVRIFNFVYQFSW